MLFFHIALFCFVYSKRWITGCVFYSFAVSIKVRNDGDGDSDGDGDGDGVIDEHSTICTCIIDRIAASVPALENAVLSLYLWRGSSVVGFTISPSFSRLISSKSIRIGPTILLHLDGELENDPRTHLHVETVGDFPLVFASLHVDVVHKSTMDTTNRWNHVFAETQETISNLTTPSR